MLEGVRVVMEGGRVVVVVVVVRQREGDGLSIQSARLPDHCVSPTNTTITCVAPGPLCVCVCLVSLCLRGVFVIIPSLLLCGILTCVVLTVFVLPVMKLKSFINQFVTCTVNTLPAQ